jgi:hypothetical protein
LVSLLDTGDQPRSMRYAEVREATTSYGQPSTHCHWARLFKEEQYPRLHAAVERVEIRNL